ncbi:MAG: hypothetical protein LBV19_06080 [Streptococcaceae bacterium]|jgi:hypothetical protein|nr:hypothetical protein [Streptococcaceae bacterium]
MADLTEAQEFAKEQLDTFKTRMHITTDDASEMKRLTDMLESSYTAILRRVGSPNASDPEVRDLIFDRARYIYNDALDEFLPNYKQDIYELHLVYKSAANDEGEGVES